MRRAEVTFVFWVEDGVTDDMIENMTGNAFVQFDENVVETDENGNELSVEVTDLRVKITTTEEAS